jgi:hypothetical protein
MTENLPNQEIAERLELIESMIAEGRRRQESWGWTFVLWGVAYYIAFFWGWLGRSHYAWPVTMIAASVLTLLIVRRKRSRYPSTTMGRAIGSIWTAMGLSMFVVLCAMGYSSHFSEAHSMIAAFAGMVGLANAACSMTLRWRAQFVCALVWWATAVAACYCSDAMLLPVFLVAVFLGQIVFGGGMMISEFRQRSRSAAHA